MPGIAGATEIGENEIVLVVDVGSLIEHFGSEARGARRKSQKAEGRVEARQKAEGRRQK